MTDVQTRRGAVFTHMEVADAHAAAGERLADGLDVVDDELDALDRAGVAQW